MVIQHASWNVFGQLSFTNPRAGLSHCPNISISYGWGIAKWISFQLLNPKIGTSPALYMPSLVDLIPHAHAIVYWNKKKSIMIVDSGDDAPHRLCATIFCARNNSSSNTDCPQVQVTRETCNKGGQLTIVIIMWYIQGIYLISSWTWVRLTFGMIHPIVACLISAQMKSARAESCKWRNWKVNIRPRPVSWGNTLYIAVAVFLTYVLFSLASSSFALPHGTAIEPSLLNYCITECGCLIFPTLFTP